MRVSRINPKNPSTAPREPYTVALNGANNRTTVANDGSTVIVNTHAGQMAGGAGGGRDVRFRQPCNMHGKIGLFQSDLFSHRLEVTGRFGNAGWIFKEYGDAYQEHPYWKHERNPAKDSNA